MKVNVQMEVVTPKDVTVQQVEEALRRGEEELGFGCGYACEINSVTEVQHDLEKNVADAYEGLLRFRSDFKPFVGNQADWSRFDTALDYIKKQKELQERL